MKNFLISLASGVMILVGIALITANSVSDWVIVLGSVMTLSGLDLRITTLIREKRQSDGR